MSANRKRFCVHYLTYLGSGEKTGFLLSIRFFRVVVGLAVDIFGHARSFANYRPVLNGEHYLTGEKVCKRLCISKRTLQDYRDTGLLGYVQLPGKIIYRESDIMDLLERFYQK